MLSPPLIFREDRGGAVQESRKYLSDGASISLLFLCCCVPGSSEARGLFIDRNAQRHSRSLGTVSHYAASEMPAMRHCSTLRDVQSYVKRDKGDLDLCVPRTLC